MTAAEKNRFEALAMKDRMRFKAEEKEWREKSAGSVVQHPAKSRIVVEKVPVPPDHLLPGGAPFPPQWTMTQWKWKSKKGATQTHYYSAGCGYCLTSKVKVHTFLEHLEKCGGNETAAYRKTTQKYIPKADSQGCILQ